MNTASGPFTFSILLRSDSGSVDEYAHRAYGGPHIDDALLGGPHDGIVEIDFERSGPSLREVVLDALGDVAAAFPEATVLRVEPEDLVTVGAIARRAGRTHESVRLLIKGERGPGGFPPPAGLLDEKTRVWRWHEVAGWLRNELGLKYLPPAHDTQFLAALNDVLDLRALGGCGALSDPELAKELARLLPPQLQVA